MQNLGDENKNEGKIRGNSTLKAIHTASAPATNLSATVTLLRQRFRYGESPQSARSILCPPEVVAAIPPDGPGCSWDPDWNNKESTVPAVSPKMVAESESARAYFEEQEQIWRADLYANGLQHDLAWRREWCDRVGLGFSIGPCWAINDAPPAMPEVTVIQ